MTARSLLNPMTVRNTKRVIGQNKKLLIVISILQALGIPLCALVLMLELLFETFAKEYDAYSPIFSGLYLYIGIGVACLGAAVVAGIIAAISVYQELWKKSKVDMLYSLPLTGTQRFLSHYIGGLFVYLVPYIIAVLLGWLVVFGMSIPIDFSVIEMEKGEFLGQFAKYYSMASVGLGLLMLLYYTTTTLLVSCCGTIFEGIYSTLLFNVLMPGALAAIIGVICANVEGLNFEYTWQAIGYTSPLGGLIYLVYILSDAGSVYIGWNDIVGSEALSHGMVPNFLRWALVITLIIAAVLVLNWKLYQRRKAEAVGTPFVYVGAYYLLLTLVTVLILCMSEVGVLGAAILFSAIVYFVMEVIRKRGFRKFWLTGVTYVTTVVVTLSGFWLIAATDGLGRAWYIPPHAAVSSLRIEMIADHNNSTDLSLEFTDKDVIKAVQEVQKDIIADYRKDGDTTSVYNEYLYESGYHILEYGYDDYGYSMGYSLTDPRTYHDDYNYNYSFSSILDDYFEDETEWVYSYAREYHLALTYYTYTGSTIHRTYYINGSQLIAMLDAVRGTELWANASADQLKKHLTESGINQAYENDHAKVPNRFNIQLSTPTDRTSETFSITGGQASIDRIAAAFRNDLKNVDPKALHTSGVYGILENQPIYNCYTETIAVLEELGVTPFDVSEIYGFNSAYNNQYTGDESSMLKIRIYNPGDFSFGDEDTRFASEYQEIFVLPQADAWEYTYYCDYTSSIETDFPELNAVLESASSWNVTGTDGCLLVVNGRACMIPAEDKDLIDALIAAAGDAEDSLTGSGQDDYQGLFGTF